MRRRYRYDEQLKQLVEVGADWQETERRAPVATEELIYGHLQGPGGEDLSTRKRHADFMKREGLVLEHEARPVIEQGKREREAFMNGTSAKAKAERMEAIRESFRELWAKGPRGRR